MKLPQHVFSWFMLFFLFIIHVEVAEAQVVCETTPCTANPHLYFDHIVFNDTDCNDNGVLDPGDYGYLEVFIGNDGNDLAYNTEIFITCPTCPIGWGGICDLYNPAPYGTVPFGTSNSYGPSIPFLIAFDTAIPCGMILEFQLNVRATTTNGGLYSDIVPMWLSIGHIEPVIRYEEHFLLDPDFAGSTGRLGFSDAWISSTPSRIINWQAPDLPYCTAGPPFWHNSDGDGWQGRINRVNDFYHIFDMSSACVNIWLNWEIDVGYALPTWTLYLDYTDDGSIWRELFSSPGSDTGGDDWQCIAGSVYETVASLYPGLEDLLLCNPFFGLRFRTDGPDVISPAMVLDNIILQGDDYICTASPCDGTHTCGFPPYPVPRGDVPTEPVRATKNVSDINVSWDTFCQLGEPIILYGNLNELSTYTIVGGECFIGSNGNYTWLNVPGDIFFLLVGTRFPLESSWGIDSSGTERGGTVGSGMCGLTTKDSGLRCP